MAKMLGNIDPANIDRSYIYDNKSVAFITARFVILSKELSISGLVFK